MPALAEDQLNALVESLTEYSEASLSAAIEAAKDPEVARQFIDHLTDDLTLTEFTDIALAVALGEAKVAEAAPALLRMAIEELFETSVYTDAAVYALQRLGPPAFEEVMRYLQAPADDYDDQAAPYDVLLAAADANLRVRTDVADFCYARLDAEKTAFDAGEANLAYACCQVLVFFGDQRVRPFHEREAEEDGDFEDLLDELDQKVESTIWAGWREPWQKACSEFAVEVKEYEQGFDPDAGEVEEETQLLDEPEIVARRSDFAKLVEEFNATPEARAELTKKGATDNDLNVLLNYGIEDIDREFDFTNKFHLYKIFYKLLPREMVVDGDAARRLSQLVAAFLRFLHSTGRLQDPQPQLELLDKAAVEVPPQAEDANKWGFEKRLQIEARLNGFDLSTGEGVNEYAEFLARRIHQREQAAEASTDRLDADPLNHTPFRRESPTDGRHDPCPCGSGKKYKMCCGK